MGVPLQVLIVEDSGTSGALPQGIKRAGFEPRYEHVETAEG